MRRQGEVHHSLDGGDDPVRLEGVDQGEHELGVGQLDELGHRLLTRVDEHDDGVRRQRAVPRAGEPDHRVGECGMVALDLGQSGPVEAASAYFMKSPPVQKPDHIAREELEAFLSTAD